jgi:hypothetical protein
MSYGFQISNVGGTLILSSDDLTYSLIDLFSVSQTSSGSRTYANLAGRTVIIAQTAVEPTSIDFNSLISFNSMNISSYDSGTNKIVSWSPGTRYGTIYDVQIYIFGY